MEILTPDGPARGAVLVIHSWWGLTPSFRTYGAALAAAGFAVGLADLFEGETATTEAEARALRRRPRRVPMYRSLGRDIDELRAGGPVGAKLGVAGFSMGGHWAVWLSQRPEYAIAATVLCYAARGGDCGDCGAAIQAHFADADPWVSAQARKGMASAIRRAGCRYEAFDYPGTGHWFAESDRAEDFDPAAAALVIDRSLRHFGQYLSD